MDTAPRPGLLALYRWTLRLAPEAHQREYAEEQVLLFEEVWRDERPASLAARALFSVRLVLGSVLAALAVRADQWQRSGRRRRGRWTMGSDVRFTWRAAARSPWYAATVVGVMALTIALAATTLAIVDGVLFRPLPFPDADRLVSIQPDFEGLVRPTSNVLGGPRISGVTSADLEQWRRAAPEFPMTGFTVRRWSGLGSGVNDDVAGMAMILPDFFDVIGVRPLVGGFAPEDYDHEPPMRPVLVTHTVWQTRFAGRSDIVGQTIVLNRVPETGIRIVGVMPPGFLFPSVLADVSFLAPLVLSQPVLRDGRLNRVVSEVVARRPDGVTAETLRFRLLPALKAVAEQFPQGPKPEGWSDAGWRRTGPYDAVHVLSLRDSLREFSGPMFRAGMFAVVFLVLIAAANVSSLMTARALERERELLVRRSLGAGWAAIARLWAVEAGVLMGAAGVIGLAAAPVLLGVIVPLLPDEVVLLKTPAVDWRVGAIIATGLAVLVACVSVAPIRRSLRRSMQNSRGASERSRSRGRVLVIAGQVAVAFTLTVLGASLVGSVMAVYAHEQPVTTDGILALSVMVTGEGDAAQRGARIEHVRQRLASVPGVTAVAGSGAQVLAGGGALPEFEAPPGTKHPLNTDTWPVTDGFYDTLAPQLVTGRVPTAQELRASAPVVVVSQRAAETYWPEESAIGRELVNWFSKESFTVIGVVRDVRWVSWDTESPIIYGPYARLSRYPWVTLFVRSDRPAGPLMAEALATIKQTDPLVTVRRAAPLKDFFRETIALRRFQSWLFGGFAAAALVVMGAGLLGLLAMSAARRTREVGIRCALGATPGSVTTLLVREQMVAVIMGLLVGATAAAWAIGFVESWLYELTPSDPRIWAAAAACLLVMAAIGILIPAVKASRIDPLVALRAE
jgi:putative ABC transport system permease protein